MVSLNDEQTSEVISELYKTYTSQVKKHTQIPLEDKQPIGIFILFEMSEKRGKCTMIGDISPDHVIAGLKEQIRIYQAIGNPKDDSEE